MNGLTPNCLDDFLFSNTADRAMLELILSCKLPFPFSGKTGILLHGTWGTGKTTLAELLPELIEAAHSKTWNMAQGIGQMPAIASHECHKTLFRCGGGLSSTEIIQKINGLNNHENLFHYSKHDYFVLDEVERLTIAAQQSLRSPMGLKRCMFFLTTNYLSKVDRGIVNRCHLVEMNQITAPSAYVPLGQSIVKNMGLKSTALSIQQLRQFAINARGSMRDYINDVVLEAVRAGGVMP